MLTIPKRYRPDLENFVSTPESSPPSFYTKRDEDAPNLMPYMNLMFEEMDRTPWWAAEMVLGAQTELTAPLREGGLPVYRESTLCSPRQTSKTEAVLWPEELVRGYLYMTSKKPAKTTICHISQNATSTLRVFEDKLKPLLKSNEFNNIDLKPGSANPHIIMKKTGSRIYVISSKPEAGRGLSPDMLVIDEMQAQTDTSKMRDMEVSTIQQAHARILKMGTAGDYKSRPWNEQLNSLKSITKQGLNKMRGMSFFYWSAEELAKHYQSEDGDKAEEIEWYYRNDDRILTYHPAINQPGGAFDMARFLAFREQYKERDDFDTFKREFLNIELSTSGDQIISEHLLKQVLQNFPANQMRSREWVMAVDSQEFSPHVSIALASGKYVFIVVPACPKDRNGRALQREYVDHANFVSSVSRLLEQLPIKRCITRPGSDLTTKLREAKLRLNVEVVQNQDYALACARFYRNVSALDIQVHNNTAFEEAVANGGSYKSGGGWYWKAITPDVDISPLVAVTLAHDGAKRLEYKGRPRYRVLYDR